MTKFLFGGAFLVGALAILWIGRIFLGADTFGLSITILIGAVYLIGTYELVLFRRASVGLSQSLAQLSEPIDNLAQWLLEKVEPSLQNSVRLRVEGGRNYLPAPVVTPYLVGLLVMLGLLGTFIGMVDTLNGAVGALEGDSELEAIRAGLAAPIEGLGLAFGTSVAGVAASAMLGLLSTLSRRERLQSSHLLDTKIAHELQAFSANHQQQLAFKAMQDQAQTLPDFVDKLNELSDKLETMTHDMGQNLLSSQTEFQTAVSNSYTALGESLTQSFKENLVENAELVRTSIEPMSEKVLTQLNETALQTQQKLTKNNEQQLETLNAATQSNSALLREAFDTGLAQQTKSTEAIINSVSDSLNKVSTDLHSTSSDLLNEFTESSARSSKQQSEQAIEFHSTLNKQLEQLRDDESKRTIASVERLSELESVVTEHLSSLGRGLEEPITNLIETASKAPQAAADVIEQLRIDESERTNVTVERIAKLENVVTEHLTSLGRGLEEPITNLIETAAKAPQAAADVIEQLRIDESERTNVTVDRIAKLEDVVTEHLTSLGRGLEEPITNLIETAAKAPQAAADVLDQLQIDESKRLEASIENFSKLESVVTEQLVSLGRGLAGPMTLLIETASKAPQAAADVTEQLRGEISKSVERDNKLLSERTELISHLDELSKTVEKNALDQQNAVAVLINNSTETLGNVSASFSANLEAQTSKLSQAADYFSAGSVEIASLGEAFNTAVSLFSESNSELIKNLNNIESALEQSNNRSDEQLGYYVAQAREIIDHNLLSHKEILDSMGKALLNGQS